MAVLQDQPGIVVTVRTNGMDCVEYDDPDDSKLQLERPFPTAFKYVESLDDSEFTIHMKVDSSYDWSYKKHSLKFMVYVDGKYVSGVILSRGICQEGEVKGKGGFCATTQSWRTHKLKFSTVKTVDDATEDRIEKDREASKKLGLIEVEVSRCIMVRPTNTGGTFPQLNTTSFELAEKSLKGKAISHGTVYSTGEVSVAPVFWTTEPLDKENVTITAFEFRYRSRKALQQELVIPGSPPRSLTLNGLSEAELRRLAAERLEQINEGTLAKKKNMPMKREASEVEDLTGDTRHPKRIQVPEEYIDLTDE
ncbi:hypothetical protein GGR53DRAFT_483821 [Hypoxylon sp. FL1150]|nr:hypothetical protein GGR53DRAFT_483821 [Hypoxylon sp. FL1150]